MHLYGLLCVRKSMYLYVGESQGLKWAGSHRVSNPAACSLPGLCQVFSFQHQWRYLTALQLRWSMLWAEAAARIIFFTRTCESSETVVLTTGRPIRMAFCGPRR